MPNEWTDIAAGIGNLAELKVVQYILRHTWGFQEFDIHKHITVDEFVSGRKRRDGSRIDKGTGLAEQSVRNGLAAAKAHGWIEEFVDGSDKARIKKLYRLKMREQRDATDEQHEKERDYAPQDVGSEVQVLDHEVQTLDPRGPNVRPRSEIETSNQPFEGGAHSTFSYSTDARPTQTTIAGTSEHAGDQPVRSLHAKHEHGRRAPALSPPIKIATVIDEISAKFGDVEHRGSNKAQAMNLYVSSGRAEDAFVQELYQASAVTRDQVNRSRLGGAAPIGNRMAYFFSVLRDQLGAVIAAPNDGSVTPPKA